MKAWIAFVAALGLGLVACGVREPLEVTRNRAVESHLRRQIADLETLITRAESGQFETKNRLAIGLSEDATRAMLEASLPQEKLLGDRVLVRVESAQAFFRGNNAAVVLQAAAEGKTGTTARIELAGRLAQFRIEDGRLQSSVELVHFKVIESSFGEMGSGMLEGLLADHLDTLAGLVPPLDVPVRLEQSLEIGGLEEGVVSAQAGTLPLEIKLAEVIPVNQRLWILLEVKAGPWKVRAAKAAAP